jgi:hypothetical protein
LRRFEICCSVKFGSSTPFEIFMLVLSLFFTVGLWDLAWRLVVHGPTR